MSNEWEKTCEVRKDQGNIENRLRNCQNQQGLKFKLKYHNSQD